MDLIKLLIIFIAIIIVMRLKKPLYASIAAGTVVTILLYRIPLSSVLNLTQKGIFGSATINMVLAFYTITFLQRMLEKRDRLILAEDAISNLFNNRRVNTMVVPFVIGLLPSPGAVLIAAPIVENATEGYMDRDEQAFVTSYFRHISEAFLPTYAHIILAMQLANMSMTSFVVWMLPMVAVLFLSGYIVYVRKLPKETGLPPSTDKKRDVKNLFVSMWSIVLTVVLILVFHIPIHFATIGVIILNFFIDKFTINEILPMFKSAFESRIIFNTVVIMIFKEMLLDTGVVATLPGYFSVLPIPVELIYGLIFLVGTVVAGTQAIIAVGIPLAFSTIPNAGIPLLVFLMSMSYIAMQVSPTHICLGIVTEHFGVQFDKFVKKTLPVMGIFIVFLLGYYLLLSNIL